MSPLDALVARAPGTLATSPRPATRLLAGVDEAGLGPLLGPLAIGWSVVRVPAQDADPWKLLAPTVGKRPGGKRARLCVADSKKVFQQDLAGMRRLETTALGFLALLEPERRAPARAEDVLFGPLAPAREVRARHPWYERLPALPLTLEPASVELTAALLARRMEARGVELVGAGVRLVPSGELNASLARTGNKGASAWEPLREVLRHLWQRHGAEQPELVIDMLGGRTRYGEMLARGLAGAGGTATVRVLVEEPEHSAYAIEDREGGRALRVDFRVKGEDASFCVALASCLAKYAREVEMRAFNAFFGAHDASLRPTAGYRTDAWRWLAEAGGAIARAGVDRALLVRDR